MVVGDEIQVFWIHILFWRMHVINRFATQNKYPSIFSIAFYQLRRSPETFFKIHPVCKKEKKKVLSGNVLFCWLILSFACTRILRVIKVMREFLQFWARHITFLKGRNTFERIEHRKCTLFSSKEEKKFRKKKVTESVAFEVHCSL